MDSMAEINAPLVESEDLELCSAHPGLQDTGYLRRRKMFFYFARDLRLRGLESPCVPYTGDEQKLWSSLFERLDELHETRAARVYRDGKHALGLNKNHIPQLPMLEALLMARTGIRLVPAEGLLHGKSYFGYWAKKIMPCTLFLRHNSHPEYTPEPDIVHDVIGHVPPLMNEKYVELIQLIGRIAENASPQQLEWLVRFYWYTVEFGLVEEEKRMRIFGAGILSSIGEMEHVLKGGPDIRPFNFEEMIETPFDPTKLQPVLFQAPSLDAMLDGARRLAEVTGSIEKAQ